MSAPAECPICMDEIDFTKNCVTTECGHCFHARCLMTSVAHNGFGCPYCRTAMAEEVEEEDEEEDDYLEDDTIIEDTYSDNALRGLRFFMNNLAGNAHDEDDIADEESELEVTVELRRHLYGDNRSNDDDEEEEAKPSAEYIAQSLSDQGVTVEQLVKALLIDHEEYEDEETFERINDELFGKLRVIISNYTPGAEAKNTPEVDEHQIAPQETIMVDV